MKSVGHADAHVHVTAIVGGGGGVLPNWAPDFSAKHSAATIGAPRGAARAEVSLLGGASVAYLGAQVIAQRLAVGANATAHGEFSAADSIIQPRIGRHLGLISATNGREQNDHHQSPHAPIVRTKPVSRNLQRNVAGPL